jgi:hypothetical protein
MKYSHCNVHTPQEHVHIYENYVLQQSGFEKKYVENYYTVPEPAENVKILRREFKIKIY